MTFQQNVLKTFYPLLMRLNKTSTKNAAILLNKNNVSPVISFYSLSSIDNTGYEIDFKKFTGEKILIVNTASDCGYTAQYAELQKLYDTSRGKFNLLGFPSNDFAAQEKSTDDEIAKFCKINYGITFPLMKKSVVVKKSGQSDVYKWLTDPGKNGWNEHQPDWNFSKYIVNGKGILTHYFGPAVSPVSEEIKLALK
ncbi:MAG: glutathione peroxidase [Ignavibacteriaceae bacterium]